MTRLLSNWSSQASGIPISENTGDAQRSPAEKDELSAAGSDEEAPLELTLTRHLTRQYTQERLEVDAQLELEKTKSRPISLRKSADGVILVDWYTTDDPANPQNWSQRKKIFVLTQIW